MLARGDWYAVEGHPARNPKSAKWIKKVVQDIVLLRLNSLSKLLVDRVSTPVPGTSGQEQAEFILICFSKPMAKGPEDRSSSISLSDGAISSGAAQSTHI
jgi:hypothetical protein